MRVANNGIALSAGFYRNVVAPLLAGLPHAAALLGDGSEVLGYDDEVSTDHDFGPRLQVFVPSEADAGAVGARLAALPVTGANGRPFWPARRASSWGRPTTSGCARRSIRRRGRFTTATSASWARPA